jgi:hypothetical protein
LYPHLFLFPFENYVSGVLNSLSKDFKTIVCVIGAADINRLEYKLSEDPNEFHIPAFNPKYESLVTTDSAEMVIEKRGLLDALIYGRESIAKNPVDHPCFDDAFEFARFLTEQDNIDSDFTMGYQNIIRRVDNLM